MATKLKLEGKIKGFGKIYNASPGDSDTSHPFDEALNLLRNAGIDTPISLRDWAHIRANGITNEYALSSFVKEGAIYIPGKNILLIRHSPILDNAVSATSAHRNMKEFYLDKNSLTRYLKEAKQDKNKDPENRRVLIGPKIRKDVTYGKIPVGKFGIDELTLWAFKDQTKAYAKFLKKEGIKEMNISMVPKENIHSKPFVRQLFIDGDGAGSNYKHGPRLTGGIYDISNFLDLGDDVLGVLPEIVRK